MSIKDYFAPKTIVYTGAHKETPTQISHWQISDQNVKMTNDFKQLPNRRDYIQIVGLSDVEKIRSITEHFPIDPLILEDIFNVRQRNKIEFRDSYLFAVFHVVYMDGEEVKDDYISLLLYQDTLVSFHEETPRFLSALPNFLTNNEEVRKRTIDYIFYAIMDIITDHHLDVYDFIGRMTETFESEILDEKNVNQDSFYLVRKQLLKLKTSVSPVLEQIQQAMNKNTQLFRVDNRPYFDDLIDHLVRLDVHLNQTREVQRNLLDLHMNNQSTKMNRIVTTLTLFSAIFIPLSFLAGFFGMNFKHFAILEYEHSLGLFVGLCFVLAALMVLLFKKMKWF